MSLARATYGEVSGCRFVGRTASAPHASTGVLVGAIAGSRHKVERCSFAGNFHQGGLVVQPIAESASIEVNGCDFSQVAGAPIHFNSGSTSFGNVIRGRDNVFNDRAMTTGGVAADMTARQRPRPAMAVETVAAVEIPSESPTAPPNAGSCSTAHTTLSASAVRA